MKIYFIRHGESEANVLKVISNRGQVHGLTEKGRQQARALAARLQNAGITKIYSSPLLRARQTAEILAQGLPSAPPVEITDALREFDCGIAEGRSDAEAWQLHEAVRHDWITCLKLDSRIEGADGASAGESFLDMQHRFVPFIARLIAEEDPKGGSQSESPLGSGPTVALISHGGLYFAMLSIVLANISRQFALSQRMPNTAYILAETRPEGLICLEWNGEKLAG